MEINFNASQTLKPEAADVPDLDLCDCAPAIFSERSKDKCLPPKFDSLDSIETTVGEDKFSEGCQVRSASPSDPSHLAKPGRMMYFPILNEELGTSSYGSGYFSYLTEDDDPESTLGSITRQKRKQQHQAYLDNFLLKHKFTDVNKPRQGTSYFALPKKEVMYPIHVAAATRDMKILRMLLARDADPEQKSDRGRTALDVAKDADRFGSHKEVIDVLKGEGKKTVREFISRNGGRASSM
eukprot:symbB.v1.2.023438.t1/scaffold2142.1/size88058/2